MRARVIVSAAVLGLTLMAAAQPTNRGYDVQVVLRGRTTIKTPSGPKTLDVTVETIAVPNGREVTLALPERGFALFQHFGGDVEIRVNGERRKPPEGGWVTVPLPATVVIATGGDTVDLDAIILGE